jgi:hypothetical protein
MHDPENEQNAILDDDVVHHPIVTDTESMKRVVDALDRPDRLPGDPTGTRRIYCESFERKPNTPTGRRLELAERPRSRWGQLDVERLSRAHSG